MKLIIVLSMTFEREHAMIIFCSDLSQSFQTERKQPLEVKPPLASLILP